MPRPLMNGLEFEERLLALARSSTLKLFLLRLSSSFDHVNAYVRSRPCEYRLVTFTCSESYQVLPNGAHRGASPELNCGNGRNDWATVAVNGKPGKGTLFWKRPAAVELSVALRIVTSAGLLRLNP